MGAGCKDGSDFPPRNFPAYGVRLSHGLCLRNSAQILGSRRRGRGVVGVNPALKAAVCKVDLQVQFLGLQLEKIYIYIKGVLDVL